MEKRQRIGKKTKISNSTFMSEPISPQLSQQQLAKTTLNEFSQQGYRYNDRNISSNYKYHHKLKKYSWKDESEAICPFGQLPSKKNQKKTINRRTKTSYSPMKQIEHEHPSSMLLQLTKSLVAIEPNRDYKVRVKARCSAGGMKETQREHHYLSRDPENRQKLRISCHIIPNPLNSSNDGNNEPFFLPLKIRNGGAIKKIKRDLICSLQRKMQDKNDKMKAVIQEISRSQTKKSATSNNHHQNDSFYRTGVFKESMKLKMKKHKRIETEPYIETQKKFSRYLQQSSDFQTQKQQANSITQSNQFQILESLLIKEKN